MSLGQDIVKTEFFIYLATWIGAVLYSLYCFTRSSNAYFQHYHDHYSDFQPGWSFLSQQKDDVDGEWKMMKHLIKRQSLWLIPSTAISELFRLFKLSQILPWWQISISVTYILFELGPGALALLILQPLIFSLALKIQKKSVIWGTNIVTLALLWVYKNYANDEEFRDTFRLDTRGSYFVFIGIYWMNLRCMSYCLDAVDANEKRSTTKFFSYCLYLPLLISGPFIPFNNFEDVNGNFWARSFRLCLNVTRFLFWLFFLEWCLHFIYVNAIAYHPQIISSFDSWSLYGYGYAMGQFFHIKYLVTYGLTTSFAQFDHIQVPTLPICIGRVHLYSDMWKYFDAGLYTFLLRYIYIPLRRSYIKNKLLSSILCFAFVYVWHGAEYFILIWSVLNYVSIITEQFAGWLNKKYLQNTQLCAKMGPYWFRRITCVAASPLLALSAISNFFFFADTEIGFIFVTRILTDTIKSTVILWTIIYAFCQVSTELRSEPSPFCKKKKNCLKNF